MRAPTYRSARLYAAKRARSCGCRKSTGVPFGMIPVGLTRADRVVAHDVIARLDGLGDARDRIEFTHVVQEIWIIGDPVPVAFEQREIGNVETHQRGEQPPVGLGDLIADQIALASEPGLDLIERGKQRVVGFVVGGLRAGKAAAIDAVVDGGIDLRVDPIDLGAQMRRIEIRRIGADAGELRIEHADDFGGTRR